MMRRNAYQSCGKPCSDITAGPTPPRTYWSVVPFTFAVRDANASPSSTMAESTGDIIVAPARRARASCPRCL
jgi:hypothetical protein